MQIIITFAVKTQKIHNNKMEIKDNRLEAFKRLLDILDELREKCPWDREQTMESLRNNTIEETYELIDAITEGDFDEIKQELGDLMLHVVFYSKIAEEQEEFNITDVLNFLCDKLVFRHPHIFGDKKASSSEEVRHIWEEVKLKERKKKRGVLDGVPVSLPAMVKAYRMGEKAASAGFDWENKEDVWHKVKEEIGEVEAEMMELEQGGDNMEEMEGEFGDLLFSIINASRLYGVDPEMALERCNKKFITRFRHIEKRAEEAQKTLSDLSLEQMEAWWQEAKNK